MARSLWNGVISFGLLHAPVTLYPASQRDEIDFDWLERDTLEPIGYRRVVKASGEEVEKEDIVKGIRQADGSYVVLSDEEIKSANVKSTHTISIVSFSGVGEIPFVYFETPYFLVPAKGDEKVYVLLREALRKVKKIGVALVVLHNKQHLAALMPTERAIVLNTLRWATEIKDASDLGLPEAGLKPDMFTQKELAMATQLIESMSEKWNATQYRDTFRDDIMKLVKRKIKEGKAETIPEQKAALPENIADVETDLTELLKRSLQGSSKRLSQKEIAARMPTPLGQKSSYPRNRGSKTAH